jgi:hypothetical protein
MLFNSHSLILKTVMSLNLTQGIFGKVYRERGNQMSAFGSAEREPIATAVWIFTGQIMGQEPCWSVAAAEQHPQWLATVMSDESGNYGIGLPAGEFTLFAQYDADLYLNAFAGPQRYESVMVQAGQLTRCDLVNTEAAIY